MLYPQGNFYPQNFYPQGAFNQQAFQSNPFQSNLGNIPFANTLYGYPQQPTQQQAALQQHAIQQLLAHQQAAQQLGAQQQPFGAQQPFGTQHPFAMNAFPGLSNGAAQSLGAWTQQQPNTEQINPALTSRHHLLQQLAQYHYLVAQQLAQLAAQLGVQGSINPYAGQYLPGGSIPGAGQFIPGQLGGNFVSGISMH